MTQTRRLRQLREIIIRRSCVVLVMVVSSFILTACNSTACAGVGYSAVHVAIRDQQGNPQALDALVTLYDESYREQDSSRADPLTVFAAEERGGRTYDIQVSKRYYNDTWVRDVHAPGGGCVTSLEANSVTITVPVVLSIAPGAPAVRSIHLLPPHILLDRSPYPGTVTFAPYVDANIGVSRALYWRISGDTGSVSFDPVTGTLQYRCRATSGNLTVTARSTVDSTVVGLADVAVQGHPASPSDPPCI